jgi:peptide/nickel transport system substrate-binding protein
MKQSNKILKRLGMVAVLLSLTWSCNRAEYECSDCVVQYVASDPKQLTPFNATDGTANIIFQHIFQTLFSFDYQTNELVPVLAKAKPFIKTIENKKIEATFEIREGAVWDDGSPITGDDVAFSLKVVKCPFIENQQLKSDFKIIEKVIVNKENPRQFVLIYSQRTMLLENILTDLLILPKQVYDAKGLLDDYDVYELTYKAVEELQDINLREFGEYFNNPRFQKEAINGSGAYRLTSWNDNERIILGLKDNWWGAIYRNENHWFEANPKELVFEIYDDTYAGYKALKRGAVHVMNDMPVKNFTTDWYPKNSDYQADYHIFTAPTFAYDYIGINTHSPKLSDTLVRQALAYLMDIDMLINEACYGFADKVTSFTHPSLTHLANPNIKPYEFNIALADSLLAKAGWLDLDSNGVREKVFATDSLEEIVELNLIMNYNTGNDRRKIACELLQGAAAKVGVKIIIEPLELVNLLDNLKQHTFELYVGGWVASPKLADPKNIWHSESTNGGSNYVYFGNEKSDKIVEAIRKEMNPKKQTALYKELHWIIHKEIPYIFLISQQQRIAVDKRFKNVYSSGMSPGYWAAGFVK